MTDTLFFHGAALAERTGEVARGAKARCAVAYWGDGAFDRLFVDRADGPPPRVVCDLMRGGTNPAEIRTMRERGVEVRMAHMLHAKVYLSERGAVIGSANASRNALDGTDPEPLEAGVFADPGSNAHRDAGKYFEALWKAANRITKNDLDAARMAWEQMARARTLLHPRAVTGDQMSLYETLLQRPGVLQGFAVVITTEAVEDDDGLCDQFEREREERFDRQWHDDFRKSEHEAWPELYLSVHRHRNGRARVTIGRPLFTRENDDGTFDHITKLLGPHDRELVSLQPFVSNDWRQGFQGFPFARFERDLYTPEEASRLLRDDGR